MTKTIDRPPPFLTLPSNYAVRALRCCWQKMCNVKMNSGPLFNWIYVSWITGSAYISKNSQAHLGKAYSLAVYRLKVSETSHRDLGLEPMSENHSLGPLLCFGNLFFSYPEGKRTGPGKGTEDSVCFRILSNLEDSQKVRKGVNYSGTKSGILISGIRMRHLTKAIVLAYREQLKLVFLVRFR